MADRSGLKLLCCPYYAVIAPYDVALAGLLECEAPTCDVAVDSACYYSPVDAEAGAPSLVGADLGVTSGSAVEVVDCLLCVTMSVPEEPCGSVEDEVLSVVIAVLYHGVEYAACIAGEVEPCVDSLYTSDVTDMFLTDGANIRPALKVVCEVGSKAVSLGSGGDESSVGHLSPVDAFCRYWWSCLPCRAFGLVVTALCSPFSAVFGSACC